MNGDQETGSQQAGWQYRPADNPPSLAEPSRPAQYLSSDQLRQQLAVHAMRPDNAAVVTTAQAPAAVPAGNPSATAVSSGAAEGQVEWTTTGETLHVQPSSWRTRMIVGSFLGGVIIYILTRDFISTGAVVFFGTLVGFLGGRKPGALHYAIDRRGITIGNRAYGYNEFRAFIVNHERTGVSLSLVPLKRFLPVMSIQCDPALLDKVVGILADHLPMEAQRHDAFDRIINRANF